MRRSSRRSLRWVASLGLGCILLCAIAAQAHDVITTKLTYTRDIQPILGRRCSSCHDAKASIPLTSYAEVRPWAVGIKEQVLGRKMPPWGAVKGFGVFRNDNGLSEEEVMAIAEWVVGGAPEGDARYGAAAQTGAPSLEPSRSAVRVDTKRVLASDVRVMAIRPAEDRVVQSTKIVARKPDGEVVPLLWLYQFDPRWPHWFVFETPIALPAGTVVESSTPVRFELSLQ